MRRIDCDGCVHLIPKTDECGLHRSSGRPAPIAQVERCRDYAAPPPSVDRCLDALPKGLPALRANKSETSDCLKFTLEGSGERSDGNARTSAHALACRA